MQGGHEAKTIDCSQRQAEEPLLHSSNQYLLSLAVCINVGMQEASCIVPACQFTFNENKGR